jgi:8-oxo-dGTP pyrophosphatase MutT (NUDIX family)
MKHSIVSNTLLYCPEDNTVFLIKRSRAVSSPGIWCIPGGHVEKDESFSQAALREANEEVGELPSRRELSRESFKEDDKEIIIYVCSVRLEDKKSWKPRLNSESSDCDWFPIDSIPSNTFDTIKSTIKKLPSLKRMAVYNFILHKPKRF